MNRGHTLFLLMMVLAAAAVGATVTATRLSMNLSARPRNAIQQQTLWLARTACRTQLQVERHVATAVGIAVVTRVGDEVRVELAERMVTLNCQTGNSLAP